MLFISILTSDRAQDPELWAVMWRGKAPPTLKLLGAYNLGDNRRVFIWEGATVDDLQYMDRFDRIGLLETSPAFDRTFGWECAFSGDVEGFRASMERNGVPSPWIEAAVDLRRRGHQAPTMEAAVKEAREWMVRQADAQHRGSAAE